MRLRACIGILLFAASGCAGLPQRVQIDVDGRSIEIRQQGFGLDQLAGNWSPSQDCSVRGDMPLQEAVEIRTIAPGELEAVGKDGAAVRLYRCPR